MLLLLLAAWLRANKGLWPLGSGCCSTACSIQVAVHALHQAACCSSVFCVTMCAAKDVQCSIGLCLCRMLTYVHMLDAARLNLNFGGLV
jgi:hypothetical protein